MTPETLSYLAAILLSLAFSYVPGLAPRYDLLDPTYKRLIMLAALLLVSLGAFGLACLPLSSSAGGEGLVPGLTCTSLSAYALARTFLLALVANQTTYLISPKRAPLSTSAANGEGSGVG